MNATQKAQTALAPRLAAVWNHLDGIIGVDALETAIFRFGYSVCPAVRYRQAIGSPKPRLAWSVIGPLPASYVNNPGSVHVYGARYDLGEAFGGTHYVVGYTDDVDRLLPAQWRYHPIDPATGRPFLSFLLFQGCALANDARVHPVGVVPL